VLDFGLAKFADALQLTMPGSTVGTVAYMSPEQARGEEADARSDVWALGVVMYEMLTGRPPFTGAYPEATFHAIKNEPVPPLSRSDPEIPIVVQTVVARALEKDPQRRYQTAREMARDLRLLQGRTVPLDLRTEALPPLPSRPETHAGAGRRAPLSQRIRRAATPARAIAALVVVAAVAAGSYAWLTRPVVRIPVAIAPVANHTGEPELDGYRMALTAMLIDELGDSPNLRVATYPRLLQVVRRFMTAGDPSSSDAIQAISALGGVSFVLVPSVEYRGGAWLARAQVRSVDTGTVTNTFETEALASSLPKDTVLRQIPALADRIQAHFRSAGAGRAYTMRPASARFRNVDAARAFEEGRRAHDELEYARALDAFRRATALDDRHALAHAWTGRTLSILYRRNEAIASGQRAKDLVNAETPESDRVFIDAVLAETLGDFEVAERRYRELPAGLPDDVAGRGELAQFFTRRDGNARAVETYHDVLRLDGGDMWAHVQLCQLYVRLGDYPLAEKEANAARDGYAGAANPGGAAQALLCLADAQRLQGGARLPDARRHVAMARATFESLDSRYNLSRTAQYQGTVEWVDGRFADAARFFQDAAVRSRAVGNRSMEGLALMNLGVTQRHLGRPKDAIAYLRQSRDIFEQIGIERRAAEAEMNAAGLQIEFGVEVSDAVRRLANARAMFEKLGLVDFQVSAMDLEAVSLRHAGRPAEARRVLLQARSIASEKQLSGLIAAVTVSLAQTDVFVNDYIAARKLLEDAAASKQATGLDARILLALVYVRLGEFGLAGKQLAAARVEIEAQESTEFVPAVHLALGELAYESGKPDEARVEFQKAAALWIDELPDAASVEGRSLAALLDGLRAANPGASQALHESVSQAGKMGRLDLEIRCRLRLAQFQVAEGRHLDAIATIDRIPIDPARVMGPELQAQVHYWRGRALLAGDHASGASEIAKARKIVTDLQASLAGEAGRHFGARTHIRRMLEDS
jgi:tetratricopeptide (TPR) repeat protein